MDCRPDEQSVSFVLMDVLQADRQLAPLRLFADQDAGLMRQALFLPRLATGEWLARQKAHAYASERRQMRAPRAAAGAAPPAGGSLIIEHPAVQRLLDVQRVWIDGMRVVAYQTAIELDIARRHPDDARRAQAQQWCGLLTPVLKAACTDQGQGLHMLLARLSEEASLPQAAKLGQITDRLLADSAADAALLPTVATDYLRCLALLVLQWAWQRTPAAATDADSRRTAERQRLYRAFQAWVWPEFQMRMAMLRG